MTRQELPVVPGWEAVAVEPPAHEQITGGVATDRRTQVIGDPSVTLPSLEEVERGRQAAYDEGFVAGRASGFDDARHRGAELHAAFLAAVQQMSAELDQQRRAILTGIVDISVEVATAIMGRTPHDGGAALVDRIRSLCDASSQSVTTVYVATADEALVHSALEPSPIRVEVAADLAPGEVRVGGDWSTATATVSTIAQVLRESIEAALGDSADGGVVR